MVTSPTHPGLEVAVLVRGRPLQEYDDDSDEDPAPNITTKYVEAKTGASFALSAQFKPPFPTRYDVLMRLAIDGKPMVKWYCPRGKLYDDVQKKEVVRWQRDGEWMKQKFCFSELDIVEETRGPAPNVAALRHALSSKGCITLSFQFITNFQESEVDRVRHVRHHDLEALEEVPEKALKGQALSHQAILSNPQKSRRKYFLSKRTSYDLIGDGPFATFHFKYRSLASLKALRVIPFNDTARVPLEDRPEEELSPAELRELLRRMRRREAEGDVRRPETESKAHIKRELAVDNEDEVTIIETRTRKRPRVDPEIIVID